MHFLSIILRNQFTLFYRFGYTFIPTCHLISLNGGTAEATDKIVQLFKELSPFEWEEEYVILELEKAQIENNSVSKFDIQDIVRIVPLSLQSKVSIEAKIDSRIRLETPLSTEILNAIETHITQMEFSKATEALWKVCEIEGRPDKYVNAIGVENLFNGIKHRKEAVRAADVKNGNYWEYVLAYDRFDYFPNSVLGYFYDSAQIFAYFKNRSTFEGSGIHQVLEEINATNANAKIRETINFLQTEQRSQSYISQTRLNGMEYHLITPLYLMLKDELRKSEDIHQTNLFTHLKALKEYGDSFKYTLVLLSAFFGFKKFYDIYYDRLDLRFYRGYKAGSTSSVTERQQDETTVSLPNAAGKDIKIPNDLPDSTSNDQHFVEAEDQASKTKAKSGKRNKAKTQGTSSDESSADFKLMIAEFLKTGREPNFTEISHYLTERSGNKLTTTQVKNIVDEMDEIETFNKKGKRIRLKGSTLL